MASRTKSPRALARRPRAGGPRASWLLLSGELKRWLCSQRRVTTCCSLTSAPAFRGLPCAQLPCVCVCWGGGTQGGKVCRWLSGAGAAAHTAGSSVPGTHVGAAHSPQAGDAVHLRETCHTLLPAAATIAIRHLLAVQVVARALVLQLDRATARHLVGGGMGGQAIERSRGRSNKLSTELFIARQQQPGRDREKTLRDGALTSTSPSPLATICP